MSEHIELLDEKKVITSFAGDGKYFIKVHDKENAPNHFIYMLNSDKEYGYEEYCGVLKDLWDKYISKGEKPKLIEQTLSDNGFVAETLHCIAPGAWCGQSPLFPYRESFAYWLKSKLPEINGKINRESFDILDANLDGILMRHISQKENSASSTLHIQN